MTTDSPAMGDFGKEVVVVVPRKPDQEGAFINELKSNGFEVILVTSPQKILRLRENKPRIWVPAMIIIEAILPDCSAYELTRKVSEQWADVKVPLLMMSEFVSSEDEMEAYSAGASALVKRPITAQHVKEVIEKDKLKRIKNKIMDQKFDINYQ